MSSKTNEKVGGLSFLVFNSYCADGAYLHHENLVSKKMS